MTENKIKPQQILQVAYLVKIVVIFNSKAVSLHLVYKGVCESSKSYLLVIES